jgi:predicted transcriptional regulator
MNKYVVEIVAAYVGKNQVDPSELPALIATVSQTLSSLGQAANPLPVARSPAVPIRRSVSANAITCLDCGWSGKMLKRHLTTAHGLTVDQYRTRWDLACDYPIVAKGYSARRSELAKATGLGRRRAGGEN